MGKAILMSIRPEWVAKILNGEKTIEIRKGTRLHKAIQTLIKEQGVAPSLIYCTKDNKRDWYYDKELGCYFKDINDHDTSYEYFKGLVPFNGNVIARFNATSEIIATSQDRFKEFIYYETATLEPSELLEQSCLEHEQLDNYLYGEQGTAAHITKDTLTIFIKPMELKKFRRYCDKHFSWWTNRCLDCKAYTPDPDIEDYCNKNKLALTKAPQSWFYVEI